ncbi:MAG: RNA polymerase sigma-70 factor [Chitinophagaceae bacterium]
MPDNRDLYLLFETLFKEQYNSLANYAFSILGTREDAEDAVQDVFIKVWQNSPQVIETPQAKFYLITAVKNNCISYLRKQANKKFVQPEDAHLQTAAYDGPTEKKEDIGELVIKALALLPPQCLAIFKLSRFGKLTYQQIADELGLSVKTVENQVGKALRIMREYARQHNISFSLLLLSLLYSFSITSHFTS